mgnify:FL=1
MSAEPRISVVIASRGRPGLLAEISAALACQTLRPTRVVFSVVEGRDLPEAAALYSGALVVTGAPGLPAQRNRGLEAVLSESDILVFLDDDYVPSRFALAGITRFFADNPGHVGANGHLIADGINSAGIDHAEAARLVAAYDAAPTAGAPTLDLRGLYGCNMAYRAAAIGAARFDERLPLYGWQEDIDFAAQLLARGRLGKTDAFAGVHRGIKAARSSGVRLGYSQVANPLYLMRKGTMRRSYSLRLIARNVLANHWRALRQEPWVDRRGRVRGNWLALADALLGRADPERILRL